MTEKWLLCADLRTGQTLKDRINLAGTPTINLHSKTLRSVVLTLLSEHLAASKLTYLDNSATESLIHELVTSALADNQLDYFGQVTHVDGLASLLTRSIRDLRLADVAVDSLVDDHFESPVKASDLRSLYSGYIETLGKRKLVDYAGCLDLALMKLGDDSIRFPPDLIVLLSSELTLSQKESRFLDELALKSTLVRPDDSTTDVPTSTSILPDNVDCKFFSGYGEVNEVRGVVQRVLGTSAANSVPMDEVEIVYTDADSYIPLLYERFAELAGQESDTEYLPADPPVTFSDGIAAVYTRPGRALRAWLRWIEGDALQSKAVQLLREGVLSRPAETSDAKADDRQIGYSRLASNLRRISIGFKLDRYVTAIQSALDQAEHFRQEFIDRRDSNDGDENEPPGRHGDDVPRDYGLPVLRTILAIFQPLVDLAPGNDDTAKSALQKAKRFLLGSARCDSKLDRVARNKLLDAIDGKLAALEFADASVVSVVAWLQELPVESRILQSGPQPGCVHVSPIRNACHSGRKHVFAIGLDANRFPKSARVDPLLLDAERSLLSDALETSTEIADRSQRELLNVLARIAELEDAKIHFSFSTRNLTEDRDQSPSPTLVEIYRTAMNQPAAHLDDLLAHVGTPVSFAIADPEHWLCPSDGELAQLATTQDEAACWSKLESQFEHFRHQRIAQEKRDESVFNEYDGFVPAAGPELSPTNSKRRVSPSRLETFGTCPRRFFFKYGLGVYQPDQWDIDPQRWLEPITLGNLVHGLFETFLRELTAKERIPNLDRDLPRLLELLQNEIDKYLRSFPSPNEDALQRQHEWLIDACEIFLEKEQAYCQQTGARPWVLEAAIGLDDEPASPLDCRQPVAFGLRDGRVLQLGGRIDRVDRLNQNGSESYAIWDYKSGSSYGFSQEDPFKQGRKLQSFLYVGILRHRLAAIGSGTDVATSFGYFFPNTKTQGLRLQWTSSELKQGDQILQHICDLIQTGSFPATTNKGDCKFCDFNTVCGDAESIAADSIRKATENQNQETLGKWSQLRQLSPPASNLNSGAKQ